MTGRRQSESEHIPKDADAVGDLRGTGREISGDDDPDEKTDGGGCEKMTILVSACLLGENCKYNGGNNLRPELAGLLSGHTVIPVCPEVLGGLPVPRIPAEIVDGTVMNRAGQPVNAEFRAGAEKTMEIARQSRPDLIILQSRSPSCGAGSIYDGSFTGKLIPGNGVFAQMAMDEGYAVIDADRAEDVLTAERMTHDTLDPAG